MKKLLFLLLLATLPQSGWALDIGALLPSSKEMLKNVDGKESLLSSFSGPKGTLVIFTCNHCPFAKAWEDRILELGRRFKTSGVGIVLVNPNDEKAYAEDSFPEMQKRAKDKKYPVPYVVDSTSNLAKAFDATRTPESFLFDSTGKLVYHGAIDDSQAPKNVKEKYLDAALSTLVKGKPIKTHETKSIGCTIKFRS